MWYSRFLTFLPHTEYGLLVTDQFIIIRRSRFLFSKWDDIYPSDSFLSSVVLSNIFFSWFNPKIISIVIRFLRNSSFFFIFFCYMFKKIIYSNSSPVITYFKIFSNISTGFLPSWCINKGVDYPAIDLSPRFLRSEATFELHFYLLVYAFCQAWNVSHFSMSLISQSILYKPWDFWFSQLNHRFLFINDCHLNDLIHWYFRMKPTFQWYCTPFFL